MMSRGCLSVILSLSALLLVFGDARAQTDLIPASTLERLGVQRYWGLGLTLDAGESVSRIKLLDDTLYVLTDKNKAFAVHARTGVVRWSIVVADPGQTVRGPSHTTQYALFTTPAGVRVFNRQTGEFLAEPRTLNGVIIDVQHDSATVTVGQVHGVRNGDVFGVYRPRTEVELEDTPLAKLKITALEPYQAKGRFLTYDKRRPPVSGDRIQAKVELPLEKVKLPFAASSAAIADGTWMYVGAANERFYCIHLVNGFQDWQLLTPGTVSATPVLAGDLLFIAGQDGRLICLDRKEHHKTWTFQTEGPIFADLAVTPKRAFIASSDRSLYCLDAANGRRIWRERFDSPLRDAPVVSESRVYQQTPDMGLVVLSAETGEHLWKWPEKAAFLLQMDADAYLLAGEGSHRLVRVNAKTGQAKMTVDAGLVEFASGHPADQMVLLASRTGRLMCLRSSTAPRLKPEQVGEVLRDDGKIKRRADIEAERVASAAKKKPSATAGGKKGGNDWLEEDWLRGSGMGRPMTSRKATAGKTEPAEKPKATKKTEDEEENAKAEDESEEEGEKAEAEEDESKEDEDQAADDEEKDEGDEDEADEDDEEADDDEEGDDDEDEDEVDDEEEGEDDEGGKDEGGKAGGDEGGGGGGQPPGGGR